MPWLWLTLELAVELLAAWTLGVHGCMALGLAAWWSWPAWLALFVAVRVVRRGQWTEMRAATREERRFALAALGLGALASLPALVLLTPSGDDFNFFHRALWQLGHLGEPFARGDTAFGVPGLDAISPLHALTTWELGLAMTAQALGLDALGVYHNGAVVLGNLLLAALTALWLRELGFGATSSLVGVVGLVGFLYLDDPSIRSWAIAYRMLWVGKMVQWLVVLPAALLFAWRYLRNPAAARLLHPAACGVCAVATSGTGVFLLPGLLAAASLAGLLLRPLSLRRVLECATLNLASFYCFGVAALVFSGVLPQPADTRAWVDSFPVAWLDNLRLVVPHAAAVLRNVLLAFAVPALLLRGDGRAFVVGFGAALVVIFLNPLLGPLWLEAAKPGSYWRVMLLFPVPLAAGMALAAVLDARPSRSAALGVVAVVGLAAVVARLSTPVDFATMEHRYATKAPFELRLPPAELRFVRLARAELDGRRLLAAQGVSVTAALLVPTLRIEAGRLQDTRHLFSNAGDPNEGARRLKAWEWASRCGAPARDTVRAARESIAGGVDAVIVVDCGLDDAERRRAVLGHAGARFVEVLREDGYVLYLRR
jgi:hypothetical protein